MIRLSTELDRELNFKKAATTLIVPAEELLTCLEHLLATAGNLGLVTKELRQILCDHAAGNCRILIGMAADCS